MLEKIKTNIEKEIYGITKEIEDKYSIHKHSALLSKSIIGFIKKPGKLIRPILFAIGYLGFAKKEKTGLYKTAASMELLHDFMLIHDDIIDKSDTRRGKPSMHKMLNDYLLSYKNIKFNGQDLSILIGDIIYSISIDNFLSIKENPYRKEKALKELMQAAINTGAGEFIELMSGIKNISKINKNDIYKIYDLKTAYYTFSCPLSCGAILAGAGKKQINLMFEAGRYLGRAFQIKDDIEGLFSEEKVTGKSSLVDLKESKKTLIIWLAFKLSYPKEKRIIKDILNKKQIGNTELSTIKKIISNSKAKMAAENEIIDLLEKAVNIIKLSSIQNPFKNILCSYSKEILIQN